MYQDSLLVSFNLIKCKYYYNIFFMLIPILLSLLKYSIFYLN